MRWSIQFSCKPPERCVYKKRGGGSSRPSTNDSPQKKMTRLLSNLFATVVVVLALREALAAPPPQPSSGSCTYTCPQFDQGRYRLGVSLNNSPRLRCYYPADEFHQHEFFCDYSTVRVVPFSLMLKTFKTPLDFWFFDQRSRRRSLSAHR
jgi:hypothetical protein